MMKLMYITNNPNVAKIAEEAGVNWIFVDMEYLWKDLRQAGLDTVKNHHTIEDIVKIKAAVKKAKVLVRVNPIHNALPELFSSEDEIEATIKAGADIIMLPYFKTMDEANRFLNIVDGRAKTCLLVETPEAAALLEQIVETPGIDMIHIGLNDMHLALKMKFMFQLLADGSVEKWAKIIRAKGIQYGFGGLASMDRGAVPGRMILKEHYRLHSEQVIISRSFCNADKMTDLDEIKRVFDNGIAAIRHLEKELPNFSKQDIEFNRIAVCAAVDTIVNS